MRAAILAGKPMLTLLAILFSAAALASGMVVIGSGCHFKYEIKDIFRGRENALLYIWVTISTMITMAHFTVLMSFGFKYDFGYKDGETPVWMAIHAAFGIAFVFAHLFIKRSLDNAEAHPPRFLWGTSDVHATA